MPASIFDHTNMTYVDAKVQTLPCMGAFPLYTASAGDRQRVFDVQGFRHLFRGLQDCSIPLLDNANQIVHLIMGFN
jgi:hypothetical protein